MSHGLKAHGAACVALVNAETVVHWVSATSSGFEVKVDTARAMNTGQNSFSSIPEASRAEYAN